MKTLKDRIVEHQYVATFAEWQKGNMDRTYLTLEGKDKEWRGDQSYKVYFDNKFQKLVIKKGKGLTSDRFQNSLNALERDFSDVVEVQS